MERIGVRGTGYGYRVRVQGYGVTYATGVQGCRYTGPQINAKKSECGNTNTPPTLIFIFGFGLG
jgi:hypothetical protein